MTRPSFLRKTNILATSCASLFLTSAPVQASSADCVALSKGQVLRLSGKLSRPIFPGAPEFEDVRNGDEPEPAYILALDEPLCTTGDEFLAASETVTSVHLTPTQDEGWFDEMNGYLGKQVMVTGTDPYGSHTGHHHAPLLMTAIAVAAAREIGSDPEAQATTVRAFYLSLEAGDGAAASQNVIEGKRQKGPFSAEELSSFYGNLTERLKLVSVTPVGPNSFRARYRFKATNFSSCDGSAIVEVDREKGNNLISAIRSETGC